MICFMISYARLSPYLFAGLVQPRQRGCQLYRAVWRACDLNYTTEFCSLTSFRHADQRIDLRECDARSSQKGASRRSAKRFVPSGLAAAAVRLSAARLGARRYSAYGRKCFPGESVPGRSKPLLV
jgi:hypothetical protein